MPPYFFITSGLFEVNTKTLENIRQIILTYEKMSSVLNLALYTLFLLSFFPHKNAPPEVADFWRCISFLPAYFVN